MRDLELFCYSIKIAILIVAAPFILNTCILILLSIGFCPPFNLNSWSEDQQELKAKMYRATGGRNSPHKCPFFPETLFVSVFAESVRCSQAVDRFLAVLTFWTLSLASGFLVVTKRFPGETPGSRCVLPVSLNLLSQRSSPLRGCITASFFCLSEEATCVRGLPTCWDSSTLFGFCFC